MNKFSGGVINIDMWIVQHTSVSCWDLATSVTMAPAHIRLSTLLWSCLFYILASAQYQLPRNWCYSKNRHGYYQHPISCTSYISCWNRNEPLVQRCQNGLYFDPKLNTCNFPSQVICSSKNISRGTYEYRTEYPSSLRPRFTNYYETRKPTQIYPTQKTSVPRVVHSVYKDKVDPRWLSAYERQRLRNQNPSRRPHTLPHRPTHRNQRPLTFDEKFYKIQTDMTYLTPHILAETHNYYTNTSHKARTLRGHRRPFRFVQSFLGNQPEGYLMGKTAFKQLEFLKDIRKRYTLSKEEMGRVCLKIGKLKDLVKPNRKKVRSDMDLSEVVNGDDECPFPTEEENDCDRNTKFRSIDGSCNNLRHPLWGRSMKPLLREVLHDYEDGISEPRSRGVGRKPLKSAREISLALMPDEDRPSHTLTILHMTFGQLLDHDIARTAMTMIMDETTEKLVDVECGESGCNTTGAENAACHPIELADDDPDFRNFKKCLMFVRSQEVTNEDCALGPREQLNQVTSYLDASFVYGNFLKDAETLRNGTDTNRGRLYITPNQDPQYRGLLPQKNHKNCRDFTATRKCFLAGDTRANEQIALASLHTIFHRYHNDIEERLRGINQHWDGERLYQEARRIVGAIWQLIVYNEYLPPTLGPAQMRRFGLKLLRNGYYNAYDESVNVDAGNGFQTAAFRFGHSQVTNTFPLGEQNFKITKELKFSQVFDRPTEIYDNTNPGGSGLDCIMLGQLSHDAEGSDNLFAKEVTANLFSENPTKEPGTDLPALNIHRGRDHGLSGYMRFREWCGLSVTSNFNQLHDIPFSLRRKLKQVYDHVYDIDLFAGGMIERPLQGALVGPTFACLIGRQFRKFRVGDRFWFERQDPVIGFTSDQLSSIRQMTMARIMCDTMDYVKTIQKYVFLHPFSLALKKYSAANDHDPYTLTALYNDGRNERRPCYELADLDISLWREHQHLRRPPFRPSPTTRRYTHNHFSPGYHQTWWSTNRPKPKRQW